MLTSVKAKGDIQEEDPVFPSSVNCEHLFLKKFCLSGMAQGLRPMNEEVRAYAWVSSSTSSGDHLGGRK